MIGAAGRAASIAVTGVGQQATFAAVARVAIAVAIAGTAGSQSTGAVVAGGRRVGVRAHAAAGIAIVHVGLEAALAAVARVAIAVAIAGITGSDGADAADAAGGRVGKSTHVATAPAIVDIRVEVDLTTVAGIGVAIAVSWTTAGHLANAVVAHGRATGGGTNGATGVAVVDVGLQIDLTTVVRIAVAIGVA